MHFEAKRLCAICQEQTLQQQEVDRRTERDVQGAQHENLNCLQRPNDRQRQLK